MMKKRGIVFCLLIVSIHFCYAQRFSAEKGIVSFFSDAAIEDIEAVNTVVGSLFNSQTGEVVYIMKIRDFVFEKSLMREHFNEKYMESEKFPKATFQGKITGFNPSVQGEQKVRAIGKLNLHGVTRDIDVPGTIQMQGGKMIMKSKFMVKLNDYNIKIPTLIWQNIAEQVEVNVDITYKPL